MRPQRSWPYYQAYPLVQRDSDKVEQDMAAVALAIVVLLFLCFYASWIPA